MAMMRNLGPVLAGGLAAASLAAEAAPPRDLAFDVLRKGERIGAHVIAFREENGRLEVEVNINLAVKVLLVTVFRYDHVNHETWENGRLVRIVTHTDDDGEAHTVRGEAEGDAFRVTAPPPGYTTGADVMPTSWWNPDTVRRAELLNSQKGELMRVKILPGPEETVVTAAGEIAARRYLVTGDADLELWYDREDRLAKIRFKGGDGAPIEYRRLDR
jgi:hypothetical protein